MTNSTDKHNGMNHSEARDLHIGVIFGGRSSEHEVSLASAQNVIQALTEAGYRVTRIGISPAGRWLTGGDPLAKLVDSAKVTAPEPVRDSTTNGNALAASAPGRWDLLPRHQDDDKTLAGIDVIFPVLHGPFGEDGTIQGLLEMANLPYVGCGVLSSAVAMDKAVAKQLLAAEGIPQTRCTLVQRHAWRRDENGHFAQVCAQIEHEYVYPVFVKPANLGSSVGVSKARNREELIAAIDLAAEYDRRILVEEAVPHAREIEVSVLGNHAPIASLPGEVIPGNEFYDYEAKYLDDSSALIIPASLDAAQISQVQEMALTAFRALDGTGLARVDFLMNGETGDFYLNEINTMPGFTRSSMYPKLWEASGITYPELVHRLVQLAVERYAERGRNRTTR